MVTTSVQIVEDSTLVQRPADQDYVSPPPPVTEYTGFGDVTPPGLGWADDIATYTLGQPFRVDTAGLFAVKIRWFIPSGSPAPTSAYYVALYEVGSTTPAAVAGPISGISIGAWNEQPITPVALSTDGDYVAAVRVPGGYYGYQAGLMPLDPDGPINFDMGGTFNYNEGGPIANPSDVFGSPWYGIDVTLTDNTAAPPPPVDDQADQADPATLVEVYPEAAAGAQYWPSSGSHKVEIHDGAVSTGLLHTDMPIEVHFSLATEVIAGSTAPVTLHLGAKTSELDAFG